MRERPTLGLSGDDEIARWLAALDDARGRTFELIDALSDADLDRGEPNTIGSVLYHLAAIEADYLFDDICGTPEAIPMELFPHDVREEGGVLTPIRGMTVGEHRNRLETVRGMLVEHVRGLDPEALHRTDVRADYDISPAYVLYHLTQYEAEHRAETGRALG